MLIRDDILFMLQQGFAWKNLPPQVHLRRSREYPLALGVIPRTRHFLCCLHIPYPEQQQQRQHLLPPCCQPPLQQHAHSHSHLLTTQRWGLGNSRQTSTSTSTVSPPYLLRFPQPRRSFLPPQPISSAIIIIPGLIIWVVRIIVRTGATISWRVIISWRATISRIRTTIQARIIGFWFCGRRIRSWTWVGGRGFFAVFAEAVCLGGGGKRLLVI